MDEDNKSSSADLTRLNGGFHLYTNFDKHCPRMKKLAKTDKIFMELYAREHQLGLRQRLALDDEGGLGRREEAYKVPQNEVEKEEALADLQVKIEEQAVRKASYHFPKTAISANFRLLVQENWLNLSKYSCASCASCKFLPIVNAQVFYWQGGNFNFESDLGGIGNDVGRLCKRAGSGRHPVGQAAKKTRCPLS